VLRLAVLDGVGDSARADLTDWVRRTAAAQANWWRGFTAPHMLVGLVPSATRRPVGYGRTVPGGGPTVMVEVAREVDKRRLFDDWVLTHELVHTGMPFIRGRATWFMEGAATYIEPIVRARAGWKTEEEVWREWIDNMPRGVAAFASGQVRSSSQAPSMARSPRPSIPAAHAICGRESFAPSCVNLMPGPEISRPWLPP